MSNFATKFGILFVIEAVNIVGYNIFLMPEDPRVFHYSSMVSVLITTAVLFYVGWLAADFFVQKLFRKAAALGLLLWLSSTVVLYSLLKVIGIAPWEKSEGFSGPWVAFILFSPVAVFAPMVGASLRARKLKRRVR